MDTERLRELHAQGLSDHKIANTIGVSRETIRYHRTKLGLPSHRTIKPKGYRTKKRIIKELQKLAQKLGHSPALKETPSSLWQYAIKLFGSWNKAKISAGLKIIEQWEPRPKHDYQSVFNFIVGGGVFTRSELRKRFPSISSTCLSNFLRKIIAEGRVNAFRLQKSARGSPKFNIRDLLGKELINEIIYWTDDEKLVQFLFSKADFSTKPKRVALTHCFRASLPRDVLLKIHALYSRPQTHEEYGGGRMAKCALCRRGNVVLYPIFNPATKGIRGTHVCKECIDVFLAAAQKQGWIKSAKGGS